MDLLNLWYDMILICSSTYLLLVLTERQDYLRYEQIAK